jgi:UrcA family protein
MNRIICAAATAFALLGAAGAVQAQETQMRVKVSDLNVATAEGAKIAFARIRFSAASFCDADAGRQSLQRSTAVQRCVAEMTRKGVDGLHAPLVTALLEGRPAHEQTQVASAR